MHIEAAHIIYDIYMPSFHIIYIILLPYLQEYERAVLHDIYILLLLQQYHYIAYDNDDYAAVFARIAANVIILSYICHHH